MGSMLTQLTIENFGLIDRVSLEFDEHLNIFTGETGAGKSILIGALRIVLGDRINVSQLRAPKKACTIEAVFSLIQKDLRELDIFADFFSEDDDALIIHRTFQPEGRHKIKVNGISVTISQLKQMGNYLVDFHGPHDHQMLLAQESHIQMLDRLVNFGSDLTAYERIYKEYRLRRTKLHELQDLSSSRERELDLLAHQLKELEQVTLDEFVYEELMHEQAKVNHVQDLNESLQEIVQRLDGDHNGPSENIRKAFGAMKTLNTIDTSTKGFMVQLAQIQEIHTQLLQDLNCYAEGLSVDSQTVQQINTQCDHYETLKRKYGPTFNEVKHFYLEAKEKYDLLVNLEHNDAELQREIKDLEKQLKQCAKKITQKRKKAAVQLKQTIEKELSELGIAHVEFEARVESVELQTHGHDDVTFYISPNAGESLKPLAEIVSSGEAARVMLALKKALIKVDPIPVLIFDEIDAQIGGRLGSITGKKLKEISQQRQVILITHLPQIASFADAHFKVTKSVSDGRALTGVTPLDKKMRVKEIAKMMSGENESKISVKHAEDMLVKAGQ